MDQSQLIGYIPKVTIYERKDSKCRFWMNYNLPNGKRNRRPCGNKKKEAGLKARIKQTQLGNGSFDEDDRKKLGNFLQSERRYNFKEAKELYLELTADNKTPRTLKRDEYLLDVAFGFFERKGAKFLNDVTPVHCQRLLSSKKAKGLKRSSIENYWKAVSKVYTKLRKMKLIKLDNPMEDVNLPKGGKKTRERTPKIEEVRLILSYLDSMSVKSTYVSPFDAIIRFTLYTGARIGEVLHAEWGDFDLERSVWNIQSKPNCPGVEGLGWSPKWEKERNVKLIPEALEVLDNMPRVTTIGYIKGDEGKSVAVPADFVFPKKDVKISENCKMKSKRGHYKCIRCREYEDKELCEYRVIVYSRCDSIKTAWKTLCRDTGITDLHVHDLRRFFNRVYLQQTCGYQPHESGVYIGNSEEVNRSHYSTIDNEVFERMSEFSFTGLINEEVSYLN
ncbi:MAG: tyrosine-type recombinase/integrase [Deltaproteobacteria bacterium]|nr:tyrosine-type recombinase/integrase [Deltaproteobacteria bacterium]MBT6498633.1 tyrosine-type recombinase/integrase [Deltaproteobacteria bacterium]MBT7712615.1 tyrosine-type recombinase/integrase [Deltaproteobacteria bacterium]